MHVCSVAVTGMWDEVLHGPLSWMLMCTSRSGEPIRVYLRLAEITVMVKCTMCKAVEERKNHWQNCPPNFVISRWGDSEVGIEISGHNDEVSVNVLRAYFCNLHRSIFELQFWLSLTTTWDICPNNAYILSGPPPLSDHCGDRDCSNTSRVSLTVELCGTRWLLHHIHAGVDTVILVHLSPLM